MKRKVVSPQGKAVEATENLEDMSKHGREDYDLLRSGVIDVPDAMARAALIRAVIATEMLGLLKSKLLNEKPNSKFLGMSNTKELTA